MTSLKIKGFTLIELIIVIILIGILASIAIPRFFSQTTNARIAALKALVGTINASAGLAQIEYRAEGNSSSSATTTITMDGASVTVLANSGYPVASASGIGLAARILSGFTPTYDATAGTVRYDFNPSITNCSALYTATAGTAISTTSAC